MIQFYYVLSVLISILLYFKLKLKLNKSEENTVKLLTIIPFINILILIYLLMKYFYIWEE